MSELAHERHGLHAYYSSRHGLRNMTIYAHMPAAIGKHGVGRHARECTLRPPGRPAWWESGPPLPCQSKLTYVKASVLSQMRGAGSPDLTTNLSTHKAEAA